MTAAAPRSPEPYEVPEGGLASFLTATVGDWSDEALNADNYYDIVKPTAEQLAQFGREEDDRIAHVATGETIIPMAVFEEDPALKEALFTRMREMGIDPERYIVGNELNSINPVTGQPEFFLKKIFKGIKKAVKGVVKVFKKLAPIILSVGLNFMFPGLGTIAAGALGSGIGTLVQGGSLKDALKAAALGGAVGGLASGVGSVMQGGEFLAGVKSGLPTGFGGGINPTIPAPDVSKIVEGTGVDVVDGAIAPKVADPTALTAAEAVQQGAAGTTQPDILNQLQSGQFTTDASGAIVRKAAQPSVLEQLQSGQFTTDASGAIVPKSSVTAQPTVLEQLQAGQFTTDASGAIVPKSSVAAQPTVLEQLQSGQFTTDASGNIVSKESLMQGTGSFDPGGIPDLQGTGSSDPGGINFGEVASSGIQQNADRTFMEKVTDYMFRAGQTPAEVDAAISAARSDTLAKMLKDYNITSIAQAGEAGPVIAKAVEAAAAKAGPGLMARFGPSALALTGIGAAAGFFDPPKMEPLPDAFGGMTGQKLIDMYPSQYTLSAPGAYVAPSMGAADGGGIDTSKFPRRNGRISGPGTETSDDIPAMLSDGEFVMTAKAVRGAGNGSREAGMRNMYNMMSRFEGNA
tara:strand:- start:3120 stop:5012 length:1893 start_codon:yes stop_codon:yes gene_type:complete